jgi:hypothetical protein
MQLNSSSLVVIFALMLNLIFLLFAETNGLAQAQHSGKMTVTCSQGEYCITVICIDDKPCDTIQLNSKNSTGLRDFLENKTKSAIMPKDIV